LARKAETKAVFLANDVRILVDWMHNDILSLSGPERIGKSPAELLTGRKHSHWLELLGFERFCRN